MKKQEKDRKVQELEHAVTKYSESYYLGEPEITDEEFEALVAELTYLNPDNPYLVKVGWGHKVYGDEVPLPATIEKSLPKAHTLVEVEKALQYDIIDYALGPKIDGMSVLIEYDSHGCLKLACTRGDGKIGIDITVKVARVVPIKVKKDKKLVVRGELYIPVDIFTKHLALDYANPRAAVGGIINKKSLILLEYVHFVIHGFIEFEPPLCDIILPSVPLVLIPKYALSDRLLKEIYTEYKTKYKFPLDGLVINEEIAYKFKTIQKPATLKSLVWTKSTRNQMVPVGHFNQPVLLYGTKVRKANALHAKYVEINQLGPGSKVLITKANEIIPQITKVLSKATSPVKIPENCPDCNSVLEWEGVRLYCFGEACNYKLFLTNFISTYYTVKGITDADKIVEALDIKSFADICNLEESEIVRKLKASGLGYGQKTADKLSKQWTEGRKLDPEIFLLSLGLRDIGPVLSKHATKFLTKISNYVTEPDEFCHLISARANAGRSIVRYWATLVTAYLIFEPFLDKVLVVSTSSTIVLTGTFTSPKKEIENRLKSKQIEVLSSVKKGVDYVVCADPTKNSGKQRKAEKLGIPVLSEQEMNKKFGLI